MTRSKSSSSIRFSPSGPLVATRAVVADALEALGHGLGVRGFVIDDQHADPACRQSRISQQRRLSCESMIPQGRQQGLEAAETRANASPAWIIERETRHVRRLTSPERRVRPSAARGSGSSIVNFVPRPTSLST